MALYLIVFILSVFRYPFYKNSPLKSFPLILLLTLLAEYLGKFTKFYYQDYNIVVYNIYYLLYFSLFFYVFHKAIADKSFRQLIRVGMVLFWLTYCFDLVYTKMWEGSFTMSYLMGAGILVFCIILYYISILQSSLVLVIKTDLLFWVSVGLFLFYIGYLPIKIIRTWFYKPDSFFEILLIIQFSLIIIMYLFFLAGFLWMKKRS